VKQSFLAIIPARSGSKGIPGKNIKDLYGKPLIGYTVEAALQSPYFTAEDVICSTDSPEIAQVARSYGAAVPWLRPPELARDDTNSAAVVEDVVTRLASCGRYYQHLVLLQPTSPLRTVSHINHAIEFYLEKKADAVISVAPVRESPFWMKTMNEAGVLNNLISPSGEYLQRQQLPQVYRPNGAIYIIRTEVFLRERSFYPAGSYGFVMDRHSSVDIDEELDWIIAERLVKASDDSRK